MLGKVLYFILIISAFCGIISGNGDNISSAIGTGAIDAMKLCINITATMAFWGGIINLAVKSGATIYLTKVINPIIKILFKNSSADEECKSFISVNIISNILGLSNAATPSGIGAIKRMSDISIPKNEIGRFILINCCSLQIIPTTVAAIRATLGSKNPFDIMPSVLICSFSTIVFALVFYAIISFKERG